VISRNRQPEWLFSAIYASPLQQNRDRLWNALLEASKLHTLPWMRDGDFNQIASLSEKNGGSNAGSSRRCRFQEWINNCKLIDLGFTGPFHTWSNLRPGLARISERLDKALANVEWRLAYPEACVKHLPRTHSDHCPLLIDLVGLAEPPRI